MTASLRPLPYFVRQAIGSRERAISYSYAALIGYWAALIRAGAMQ